MTTGQPTRIPIDAAVADAAGDAAAFQRKARQVTAGGARAAVLGANDGLVTNLCLILAVAGADGGQSAVRVAGFASLIAGALSMAAGEWVSVRSQAELSEGLLVELRRLIARNPKLVLDQLVDRLVADGFDEDTARKTSTELPLDEDRFMSFTARTLFGVNPDDLGSPVLAALSSMGMFAVGAALPLIPWFITSGAAATGASVALTAVASLIVGGGVSRLSGNSAARGGLRQLAIVVLASVITFGVGSLFGTAIA